MKRVYIMKRRKKNLSVSLPVELLEILNNSLFNKSKYIEYTILQEIVTDKDIEAILKEKGII